MMMNERREVLRRGSAEGGEYVLYWMHSAQRAEQNPALVCACREANEHTLPLRVVFVLVDSYMEAPDRAYRFLLEGLAETEDQLVQRGISFSVLVGDPPEKAAAAAENAALSVLDGAYLRLSRQWHSSFLRRTVCPVVRVDSNTIVPLDTASRKVEYMAWTLRKKLHPLVDAFSELSGGEYSPVVSAADGDYAWSDAGVSAHALLSENKSAESSCPPGGTAAARRRLNAFIDDDLGDYHLRSSDPAENSTSRMSAYLHFGQISPVEIYRTVNDAHAHPEAVAAFCEQLLVRRELAFNLCRYNPHYDELEKVIPAWAVKTLGEHRNDPREHLYSVQEFEQAQTHDEFWNAAQMEMVRSGFMHNYMRMYWGKKILEWSRSPRQAFETALLLQNRYALDGRDPNTFAGVAWCFGTHDRAWTERPIFGKVRYMNARGLQRKFNMDRYLRRVESL
ncbi:MAG: deoxyribodipyrimidine photo-lyase [Fibrobacterota bacterium]